MTGSIKVRPPVPTRKVRERDSGAAARNSTAPATAAAASAGDAASRTSRVHPRPWRREQRQNVKHACDWDAADLRL